MNPQQLDQDVINLAKAIRRAETGTSTNPYQAKGASGETGAYQFMPDTWKGWASQYLGNPNAEMNVENQNRVAYSRIKELKDKGYTPAQIASAWNSGDPDAYKNGKKGVNKQGVEYDVPTYVAKVSQYYRELKGGMGGQVGQVGAYQPPAEPEPYQPYKPIMPTDGDKEKSLGRKALEFAFPILEDKGRPRTTGETVGDLGLSAMTLIPGLGLGGLAAKTAATGGAKGLARLALSKGAVPAALGTGYGTDVLSNLSRGGEGAEVLAPGLGTALGVGSVAARPLLRATKLGQAATDEKALEDAFEVLGTTRTKRGVKEAARQGAVVGKDRDTVRAAEAIKDLVATGKVKPKASFEKNNRAILDQIGKDADELRRQLKADDVQLIIDADDLNALREEALEQVRKNLNLGQSKDAALRDIDIAYKQFLDFLPKDRPIQAEDILDARQLFDNWIAAMPGGDKNLDPAAATVKALVARAIRQNANELLAQKAPNAAVKELLQKQSRLFDAQDMLIENRWREAGLSGLERLSRRYPITSEVAKTTLRGLVPAGVGGLVVGKMLGD